MLLLLLQSCCLVVKAVTQGSGDLGLILNLKMPCLRLEKSLRGTPCAKGTAAHPGMRLQRKQTGQCQRERWGALEIRPRLNFLLCSEWSLHFTSGSHEMNFESEQMSQDSRLGWSFSHSIHLERMSHAQLGHCTGGKALCSVSWAERSSEVQEQGTARTPVILRISYWPATKPLLCGILGYPAWCPIIYSGNMELTCII